MRILVMANYIKGNKKIPKQDDCRCGKSVKITERKKLEYKKIVKKKK